MDFNEVGHKFTAEVSCVGFSGSGGFVTDVGVGQVVQQQQGQGIVAAWAWF